MEVILVLYIIVGNPYHIAESNNCEIHYHHLFPPPQSPFGGDDEEELFDSICNSKIPYSRFLDNHTIDYLDKLLQRDPAVRLGCIEDQQPIRKHPFFRSIDFSRLERREIAPPYKPTVVSRLVTMGAFFLG